MENNPAWIGVHDFLRRGLNALLERLEQVEEDRRALIQQNLGRLSKLDRVRDYTYTVDQVSGDDYSVEEVVDIFNRVNSRGTPLKKADLALAHVCSLWPEARAELRGFGAKVAERGFDVDLNFLVRCLAGVATGSILLEGSFLKTQAPTFQDAWRKMQPAFEHLVGVLRQEALISGLDDLPTNYVLIPAAIYLARQGGQFPSDAVRRRFVRWIFLAGLWARYSGSTDTKLQQDVALVTGRDLDPTHELESSILRERGRATLQEGDLDRARIDSAVARLSRIVARHRDARDWFTGVRIYEPVTGKSVGGERHHIFSRQVLERAGFSDTTRINAVANRALLGQPAPREYRGASPAEYLPEVEEFQPGALRAQSVPMDRALWRPERFLDFLAARRRLLAEAMNEFIAGWLPDREVDPEQHVRALIAGGEGEKLEFKSSLRWDHREERVNRVLEAVVVKTIAGFLNAAGGALLIGVDDAGATVGLTADYRSLKRPDRDGFELHLQQVIGRDLGEAVSASFLTVNFHELARAGHLSGHGRAERPSDLRGAPERGPLLPARRQRDPGASRRRGRQVRAQSLGEDGVNREGCRRRQTAGRRRDARPARAGRHRPPGGGGGPAGTHHPVRVRRPRRHDTAQRRRPARDRRRRGSPWRDGTHSPPAARRARGGGRGRGDAGRRRSIRRQPCLDHQAGITGRARGV